MEHLTCIIIVHYIQAWVVQHLHQTILQTQAQQVTQKKYFKVMQLHNLHQVLQQHAIEYTVSVV